MPTEPFPCSSCGTLLAVSAETAGRPVPCPHCGQTVLVPAGPPDAGPPSEPLLFTAPTPADHESIFAPAEAGSEDVFGLPPALPPLDLIAADTAAPTGRSEPPEPTHAQPPVGEAPPGAAEPSASNHRPTLGHETAPTAGAGPDPVPPALAPLRIWATPEATQEQPPPSSAATHEPGPVSPRRPPSGGMSAASLVVVLLPYSLLATAAAAYFYVQSQRIPVGFEALPDLQGDDVGASRKRTSAFSVERIQPDAPLPARLRVRLGSPSPSPAIRVGDLEVEPQKVERRRINLCFEGQPRRLPSAQDALVLTLRLRNVSVDDHFVPTDPAFVRRWVPGVDLRESRPYTLLEVGASRFYGGPCPWYPTKQPGSGRMFVEGQRFHQPLAPGAETTAVVATDPEDTAILSAVEAHPGTLLWRVQLRRGLVRIRGREVSACTVVGVEFRPDQIVR